VVRTVPLIDYFLDQVLMVGELKPNGPLLALCPRVTLDAQFHREPRMYTYARSCKVKSAPSAQLPGAKREAC
jgi:hypothetical protein